LQEKEPVSNEREGEKQVQKDRRAKKKESRAKSQ
jgi:hypothetical protein